MAARRFFHEGRLAWPPVVLLVFHCLFVVVFDYVWRVLNMPFEWMLAGALAVWAGSMFVLIRVFRRNAHKSTDGL